jgi:hypothetical protein
MRMKLQLAAVILALTGLAVPSAQSAASGPEDITATLIANNNLGSGMGTVQIYISKWSTEADRTQLVTVLRESGPEALLKTLQKMPKVGSIRTPSSIGYDLHYARQTPVGEGRRIVIATDRPIDRIEVTEQLRTLDYPFTLIQMQLDSQGRGTGTMSYATKIVAMDDMIQLEDFATAPVMLTNIQAKSRKK